MNISEDHIPPFIGKVILRWIYGEMHHEIYGDLLEFYLERVEKRGKIKADWMFMWDVLLSIRNFDLKEYPKITQNNTFAMFKNYLKITLRTISKNRLYSALNILGLSLGIAATIFILQYVNYERSYDNFHSNAEDLYRVRYRVIRSGELNIDCAAAVPRVGPFMKENMPEVVDFVRAFPISGVVSKDNITFREDRIHVVDPSFLTMFSYPLLFGDVNNVLKEPNQLVITREMALKYFGKEDVVGEQLRYDSWLDLDLEIVGVTADVPNNSHLKYDFLISYETLNNQTRNDDGTASSETAWGWYDFNTYVQVKPGTDPTIFDAKFAEVLYEERGENFEKYDFLVEFPLQAITDIHLYSNLLQESEPEEQGDGEAVFFLTLIAVFILVIAWINYINLSTARSLERAKEVGIRKTMGAYRKQLVLQFLSEALMLNFISLIIGVLIVVVGIRSFNDLTNSQLDTGFLNSIQFWLAGTGIFLVGVLLSGLYPAFVLSSYKPTEVLKGKFAINSSGNVLRKSLVTFQFAASIGLISGTFIVFQQLVFMQRADLGFNLSDNMVVKSPSVFSVDSLSQSISRSFLNSFAENPQISGWSTSSNVPGDEIFWTNGIKKKEDTDDKFTTTYVASIDDKYFDIYDIAIVAGRSFSREFGVDTSRVILNLASARSLGFFDAEEAVNQKVRFQGKDQTIIGVVDDYHQMSLKTAVAPIVFIFEENDFSSYVTFKLNTGNLQSAIADVEKKYLSFFPGNPFDFFFLDDFFNRQYVNEQTFSNVFTLFAGFAIIVACLGLFGLSSFSALQKTKEIGVRKVLGAKTNQIVMLLTKEFAILIGIANVVAWPSVYFIMNNWLENYEQRVAIGLPLLVGSGSIVFVIAIITVSTKVIRTARSNPVKALRYE